MSQGVLLRLKAARSAASHLYCSLPSFQSAYAPSIRMWLPAQFQTILYTSKSIDSRKIAPYGVNETTFVQALKIDIVFCFLIHTAHVHLDVLPSRCRPSVKGFKGVLLKDMISNS